MWDKVVEKARNIKAKVNFLPTFYIRKIDSKYSKHYCPSVKKDKEDVNWEHPNEASSKDKKKAKSYNPSSANQPQV